MRIHRLPAELANQIAAGEVIERPASVVKELIENALDAGARRITVATELGGKKLIRVEDDGEGMAPEDARLALERHATSKIRRSEDLGAILTLGFRGEALPSIASVSRLTLRTRERDRDRGTEVKVNGGVVASVRDVGTPRGTIVEVAGLFYNLPARRKFLKSDAAESAHISRLVTQFALGYPEIGFTLTSGPRTVLQCPPVASDEERRLPEGGEGRPSSLAERFFQIFGERPDLIELRKEAAGLRLYGFVAALAEQGPVRGPQHVFVNRRIVKDRTIAHAIVEAYSSATIRARSPEVHLFMDMPPDRVDVNVHPTKAEVRFLEQSVVHEVIRRGLSEALGRDRPPELQLQPPAALQSQPGDRSLPHVFAGAWMAGRQALPPPAFQHPDADAGVRTGAGGPLTPIGAARQPGPSLDGLRPMMPLGQFRETFIVAVDDEGIAIVDQHVAHERILFEQVMERLRTGRLESQRLLHPLVVELSAAQRDALAGHAADLGRLGFEVEDFGGGSVRVVAVPAVLGVEESVETLRAMAEDLEGFDRGSRADDALRRLAATTACHAAVKANDVLTVEKMRYILEELRRTAYSSVCPHGRPVVLRLTRREIEKNFQRI